MRSVWELAPDARFAEAQQLTSTSVPDGVEVDFDLHSKAPVYTVMTAFGRLILPLGTWMVYDREGARPVPQGIFERLYRPVNLKA